MLESNAEYFIIVIGQRIMRYLAELSKHNFENNAKQTFKYFSRILFKYVEYLTNNSI